MAFNSIFGCKSRWANCDVRLHVWNNSPEMPVFFNDPCVIKYSGNNSTLPEIYNSVSAAVFGDESSDEVFLMISDDDTDYGNGRLSRVISELQVCGRHVHDSSVGVFVPRLYSSGKLVSPGKRFLFKGRLVEKIEKGVHSSKNFVSINSGVIISRECYKKMSPLFNINLRFYGTDTDFFVRYESFFENVFVLDVNVDHSLSEHTAESSERSLFRWGDHIYATRETFSSSSAGVSALLWVYLVFLKIKLSLRYRSFRYLWI
ncbi:hypothetical protein [Spongiibacter marinus]|uniref:hypothetical protein n=1 Tax=Spongiibacter marinus TaxID=354246 RepID=UPI001969DA02|nr:hypothetical protein [Spongiibacter marinus]